MSKEAIQLAEDVANLKVIYISGGNTRHAVTVAEWFKRPDALIDVCAYTFNKDADEYGLDPWRVVDGVDKLIDSDEYDIWLSSGKSIDGVLPETLIYISAKHFAMLKNVSVSDGGFVQA